MPEHQKHIWAGLTQHILRMSWKKFLSHFYKIQHTRTAVLNSSSKSTGRCTSAHWVAELFCIITCTWLFKSAGFHAASTLNQRQIHYWHLLTAGPYFRIFYVVALKIIVINFHLAQTWSLPHQFADLQMPLQCPGGHKPITWHDDIIRYSDIHVFMIIYIIIFNCSCISCNCVCEYINIQ